MSEAPRGGPLSPYTVIDLTRARSGPTAARQMADWGANVIKVEQPANPEEDDSPFQERHGADFQNLQRNRLSLTLNLKKPEGVAVLKKLVEKADVLIENYRPGVKHRLGIDYETLKKINPRLVYASISGFGETGPYADRPGLDQIVQGMSGLMSITGNPGEGPMRAGIAVGDTNAGLYCTIGILMALLERDRTGKGQWVQTSLLQALVATLDFQAARWLVAKEVPGQLGNNHPTASPMGVFDTADGQINIAASGHLFRRMCGVIGAPELVADPRFSESKLRAKNRDPLNAAINEKTRTRPSAHWISAMNEAGVPCGPIYSMNQVFDDPQVRHLDMAAPVKHHALGDIRLLGQGVRMSGTPFAIRRAAPELGEDSVDVLKSLGYGEAEIEAMRSQRII